MSLAGGLSGQYCRQLRQEGLRREEKVTTLISELLPVRKAGRSRTQNNSNILKLWHWQTLTKQFLSACLNLFLRNVLQGHLYHVPKLCAKSFSPLVLLQRLWVILCEEGHQRISPATATLQGTHSDLKMKEVCEQQLGKSDVRLRPVSQLCVSHVPPHESIFLVESKGHEPKHLKMIPFLFLLANIKEMPIGSTTQGRELVSYYSVHVVTALGEENDSPRKYCLSKHQDACRHTGPSTEEAFQARGKNKEND